MRGWTRCWPGVAGGRDQSLVIRGEPGVGKTALLDHLAGRAEDFRVLRVSAVEFETELAYTDTYPVLLRPPAPPP